MHVILGSKLADLFIKLTNPKPCVELQLHRPRLALSSTETKRNQSRTCQKPCKKKKNPRMTCLSHLALSQANKQDFSPGKLRFESIWSHQQFMPSERLVRISTAWKLFWSFSKYVCLVAMFHLKWRLWYYCLGFFKVGCDAIYGRVLKLPGHNLFLCRCRAFAPRIPVGHERPLLPPLSLSQHNVLVLSTMPGCYKE